MSEVNKMPEKWRPEGWEETKRIIDAKWPDWSEGFDHGADALLEALRKEGWNTQDFMTPNFVRLLEDRRPGVLAFIENDNINPRSPERAGVGEKKVIDIKTLREARSFGAGNNGEVDLICRGDIWAARIWDGRIAEYSAGSSEIATITFKRLLAEEKKLGRNQL